MSTKSRFLSVALATLAAHASLGAQSATRTQSLTITSDASTAVVDATDPRQVAQGVRTVISSQVRGVAVVDASPGSPLRISAALPGLATGPLFVIDGVPLADGYALSIMTKVLERIDLFRDAASTKPYGLRAQNGVVLIAT